MDDEALLAGIFVGGASRRMGQPKGLLLAPDSSGVTLVERLCREVHRASPHASQVLVGRHSAYEHLQLPIIEDAVSNQGPLGGLVALLEAAEQRGCEAVLALACDMPHVRADFLRRLIQCEADATIIAPHFDGKFQPLAARYSVSVLSNFRAALDGRRLALQPLLRSAKTHVIELTTDEQQALIDWDTPEDAGLSRA